MKLMVAYQLAKRYSSVVYLLMFILHILALKYNRMIRLYIFSNSLAYDLVVYLSG